MVCTVDQLASGAGVSILRRGGSAVDAAIAANAVLAVTAPHLCGMGGDLFALVHPPTGPPLALDAAGRAGSGADADALRARGMTAVPVRGEIQAVTIPGCVDGWTTLHESHGTLPLDEVLAEAIELADGGFPASPLLAVMATDLVDVGDVDPDVAECRTGVLVRRPRTANALRAVAADGRCGFYEGDFGRGLLELGDGLYTTDDLARSQARWVDPVGLDVFGHRVWTVPPPSQGYLALAAASVVERLESMEDPVRLVEAAIAAGRDRPEVLHEGADPVELLATDRLDGLAAGALAAGLGRSAPTAAGDTTYLCAADRTGTAVSLIQSNAFGFGAHLVEPRTGTFLHDRGIGFGLEPGHPAELGPGRRPPHTLSPLAVSGPDGSLHAVLGTMGGDAQPQILLQLLHRLLVAGEHPARALDAPRWILSAADDRAFATWADELTVLLEEEAPPAWADALAERGHDVRRAPAIGGRFGHAQALVRTTEGWSGAADPRALIGAALGH